MNNRVWSYRPLARIQNHSSPNPLRMMAVSDCLPMSSNAPTALCLALWLVTPKSSTVTAPLSFVLPSLPTTRRKWYVEYFAQLVGTLVLVYVLCQWACPSLPSASVVVQRTVPESDSVGVGECADHQPGRII